MPRPKDDDLFKEESEMVAMSFGDHIEELRVRLLLALLGLAVGMILTLVPPLNIGLFVMRQMQEPAQEAMKQFYAESSDRRAKVSEQLQENVAPMTAVIPADALIARLRELAPTGAWPDPATMDGKAIELPMQFRRSQVIRVVSDTVEPRNALISLSPLETVSIFLMVCLVAGLVIASPWVFYQLWSFIAAGLYRHEQSYVKKFLPFSIGLFLSGVFFCFFVVLPVTLKVLMEFNIWLGVDPSLRISYWMGFATLLPVVFGACFQTPLVMLFLNRLGIVDAAQLRDKRKFAIVIMVFIAALLTPDPTIISQLLLAVPMVLLYEVGIWLVDRATRAAAAAKALGGA